MNCFSVILHFWRLKSSAPFPHFHFTCTNHRRSKYTPWKPLQSVAFVLISLMSSESLLERYASYYIWYWFQTSCLMLQRNLHVAHNTEKQFNNCYCTCMRFSLGPLHKIFQHVNRRTNVHTVALKQSPEDVLGFEVLPVLWKTWKSCRAFSFLSPFSAILLPQRATILASDNVAITWRNNEGFAHFTAPIEYLVFRLDFLLMMMISGSYMLLRRHSLWLPHSFFQTLDIVKTYQSFINLVSHFMFVNFCTIFFTLQRRMYGHIFISN